MKKRVFANCVYYLPSSGYSWDIKTYNNYEEMEKDFQRLRGCYAVEVDGQWVEIDKVQFDIFGD